MPQRYTKCKPQRCLVPGCVKMIPRSGFGYASHMKMHVRKGEARMEYNDQYKCHEYRPLGWKKDDPS